MHKEKVLDYLAFSYLYSSKHPPVILFSSFYSPSLLMRVNFLSELGCVYSRFQPNHCNHLLYFAILVLVADIPSGRKIVKRNRYCRESIICEVFSMIICEFLQEIYLSSGCPQGYTFCSINVGFILPENWPKLMRSSITGLTHSCLALRRALRAGAAASRQQVRQHLTNTLGCRF